MILDKDLKTQFSITFIGIANGSQSQVGSGDIGIIVAVKGKVEDIRRVPQASRTRHVDLILHQMGQEMLLTHLDQHSMKLMELPEEYMQVTVYLQTMPIALTQFHSMM